MSALFYENQQSYTLEFAIKWADVLPWMAWRNLNSFNIKRSSFSTRLSSAQKPPSCEFYYPASLFCTLSLAPHLTRRRERSRARGALGADKTWLSRELTLRELMKSDAAWIRTHYHFKGHTKASPRIITWANQSLVISSRCKQSARSMRAETHTFVRRIANRVAPRRE